MFTRAASTGAALCLLIFCAAAAEEPRLFADPEAGPETTYLQPGWWAAVQADIHDSEYRISWQDTTVLPDLVSAWQAPNRAHGFRTYFTEQGIRMVPRMEATPPWQWGLVLAAYGRGGKAWPVGEARLATSANRIEYLRGALTEWYVNSPRGLEQGFTLSGPPEWVAEENGAPDAWSCAPPARAPESDALALVHLDLDLIGNLHPTVSADGQAVDFVRRGSAVVVHYAELKVIDASGRELRAWMEGHASSRGRGIRLVFDARDARWPISVDPLASSPVWTTEANQAAASFGQSVATAGDVNGDGFADVIVGAPYYDYGVADEGRVFVYHGSAAGPATSPAWTINSKQLNAHLGVSVATAGDVNGDGYSDVIIGADSYDSKHTDEGLAVVYHGSASGLVPASAWTAEGNQAGALFGGSVAPAGDVNGDGFGDVIVGASSFDNGETDEGRAFVFVGSASGLGPSPSWTAEGNQASARFGASVAAAGDVNGDGYADVIVGADEYDNGETDEGRVFAYHGSASGPGSVAAWTAEGNQASADFGSSVATAGDVNGDGFADVVIGANQYDNGQANEGKAFVYCGSASGLAASPAWTAEGNQEAARYGFSVATAGDVNGDGFADILVGAPYFDHGETDEGRAFAYEGSPSGLDYLWTMEIHQVSAYFGSSVATAGDVNGDGFSDVIVGAYAYDNGQTDEGGAFVYLGSAADASVSVAWSAEIDQAGADFGFSLASAGDVNGDGYADLLIGAELYDHGQADEGGAFLFHGSPTGPSTTPDWTAEGNQDDAHFGYSVDTAGDVNGDGYDDIVVGADRYDNGQANEGRAYVYHGSASGLSPTPAWIREGDMVGAYFGYSVATAGDVNGDGYADVIVGAPLYNATYEYNGCVWVFHGSAAGLSLTPSWTRDAGTSYYYLGYSVATAGDVNGDGLDDVLVGSNLTGGANRGRADLFLGSAAGLAASSAWWEVGNQDFEYFGRALASAGDVNGDRYSDVVIGAYGYDNDQADEGRTLVYLGSAWGLATSPSWTTEGNQTGASYGYAAASAGDVNGDGFADVVVGARDLDNGETDEGRAYLYLGSAAGLATSPSWTREGDQASAAFGRAVSSAGDVNGDGYADILVGANGYDGGEVDEGRAVLYLGNDGKGVSVRPQQRRADGTVPIQRGGRSRVPDGFQLASIGRSPMGRGPVKLEWEVKPLGISLDGTDLGRSAAWHDTGTAGVSLSELVSNLEPGLYHWRVRLLYDAVSSPFAHRSRWFTIPWSGREETDLSLGSFIGGFVWEDRDRDGILESGEPRLGGAAVDLLDSGGVVVDATSTDGLGAYRFEVREVDTYRVRFAIPAGYRVTAQDQGSDDTVDSDANRVTGETVLIGPPFQAFDATGWSAGFVRSGPCIGPDEPLYIYAVRHDADGNPVLDFQDPNQPDQVTGYNVYRSSDAGLPWGTWPLVASDVLDMDEATPNKQWVDTSGDISPTGTWYYQVLAYNNVCDAEGPR